MFKYNVQLLYLECTIFAKISLLTIHVEHVLFSDLHEVNIKALQQIWAKSNIRSVEVKPSLR